LDPGTQLDYAVTYERLMGNQTVKHKDESSVNIEMQIDSSDVSQSAAVNEED
jgi:predicted double-glycine peptidase